MIKRIPIIQDTREQKPLVFSNNVELYIEKLFTGDYTLKGYEELLCIERKSLSDLFNSIFKTRFHNCIDRMLDYQHRFLVIEGSYADVLYKRDWHLYKYGKKVSTKSVLGKLISMQVNHGIQVIFVDNGSANKYVEHLCTYLYKKFEERKE